MFCLLPLLWRLGPWTVVVIVLQYFKSISGTHTDLLKASELIMSGCFPIMLSYQIDEIPEVLMWQIIWCIRPPRMCPDTAGNIACILNFGKTTCWEIWPPVCAVYLFWDFVYRLYFTVTLRAGNDRQQNSKEICISCMTQQQEVILVGVS